MHHSPFTQDWCDAIYMAAEITGYTSVRLMMIILQNSATKLRTCPSISQNLVKRIVNRVNQERRSLEVSSFPSNDIWKKTIEALERAAVQTIKALGEVVGRVEVFRTKVAADSASYYHLSEALNTIGNEDFQA